MVEYNKKPVLMNWHVHLSKALLLFLLSVPIFSCDGGSERIKGDFKVWDMGLESTRDISYRSQGIITDNYYVIGIWHNDDLIIAEVLAYRDSTGSDYPEPEYLIVDMKGYIAEPTQLNSRAVLGPLSMKSYIEKLDSLKLSKVKFEYF